MAKFAKWDNMTPDEQEAWREKQREHVRKWRKANPEKAREKYRKCARKWREANPEKQRELKRKTYRKTRQQSAADQFFIMAGAAEQLTKLKPKQ